MEAPIVDSIIQLVSNILSYDTLKEFAPLIAISAIVSAFTSSKSNTGKKWLDMILNIVKDLVNIMAFNINKAKNADDQ